MTDAESCTRDSVSFKWVKDASTAEVLIATSDDEAHADTIPVADIWGTRSEQYTRRVLEDRGNLARVLDTNGLILYNVYENRAYPESDYVVDYCVPIPSFTFTHSTGPGFYPYFSKDLDSPVYPLLKEHLVREFSEYDNLGSRIDSLSSWQDRLHHYEDSLGMHRINYILTRIKAETP